MMPIDPGPFQKLRVALFLPMEVCMVKLSNLKKELQAKSEKHPLLQRDNIMGIPSCISVLD